MNSAYILTCAVKRYDFCNLQVIQVSTRDRDGALLMMCSYLKNRAGWAMARAMRDYLNREWA